MGEPREFGKNRTLRFSGPLQVNRVPLHDGGGHQVQSTGPIALLLETAIPDFTEAIEEHRPGQGVACLTFVQARMHTAAQLDTLQPVQDKQCAVRSGSTPAGRQPGRSGA